MQRTNHYPPIKEICTTVNGAKSNTPVYVVETYKNGTEWYRKYSDGVIEQGGYADGLSLNQEKTITFVTPYSDASSVSIHLTNIFTSSLSSYRGGLSVSSQTTTQFVVYSDASGTPYGNGGLTWEARGI